MKRDKKRDSLSETASNKNRVNLMTYADGNYIQHACILLLSLKDVISPSREYNIFLFHSNCRKEDLEKLILSLERNLPPNILYKLIPCNYQLESRLKAKEDHLNAAIYNKILIYNQLPTDFEKILFLDADIVLLRDPGDLYDLKIDNKVVAAVKDPVFHRLSNTAQQTLGVEREQYFNSGVMLVNLRKWHEHEVPQKSTDFSIKKWGLTPYHDQDALNYAIKGNWHEISPLWNPRITNRFVDANGKTKVLTKNEVYSQNLSYLVHYSGPGKPWFYMSFHPKKKIYLKYLNQSEFRDYQFPDQNLRNGIKRALLGVRRSIYFLRQRFNA